MVGLISNTKSLTPLSPLFRGSSIAVFTSPSVVATTSSFKRKIESVDTPACNEMYSEIKRLVRKKQKPVNLLSKIINEIDPIDPLSFCNYPPTINGGSSRADHNNSIIGFNLSVAVDIRARVCTISANKDAILNAGDSNQIIVVLEVLDLGFSFGGKAIAKRSPSLRVHRDSPLRVSRSTVYHTEDTQVRGTRHTCKRAWRA